MIGTFKGLSVRNTRDDIVIVYKWHTGSCVCLKVIVGRRVCPTPGYSGDAQEGVVIQGKLTY